MLFTVEWCRYNVVIYQILLPVIRFVLVLNNQPCPTPLFCSRCISFSGRLTLSRADPWQDHHRALQACILGPPGDWRRRIGRPRQSWLRTIKNNLRPLNLRLATAKRRAQERSAWRQLVTTATSMTSSWMMNDDLPGVTWCGNTKIGVAGIQWGRPWDLSESIKKRVFVLLFSNLHYTWIHLQFRCQCPLDPVCSSLSVIQCMGCLLVGYERPGTGWWIVWTDGWWGTTPCRSAAAAAEAWVSHALLNRTRLNSVSVNVNSLRGVYR